MKQHESPDGFLARAQSAARSALFAEDDSGADPLPLMTAPAWVARCHEQAPRVQQWLAASDERRATIIAKLESPDRVLFLCTCLAHLRAARMALAANRCGRIEPRNSRERASWILDWADTSGTIWAEELHPLWPWDQHGRMILTDVDPADQFEIRGTCVPGQSEHQMEIRSQRGIEIRTIRSKPS